MKHQDFLFTLLAGAAAVGVPGSVLPSGGHVTLLVGRPGTGKARRGWEAACGAAANGLPAVYFSLGMNRQTLLAHMGEVEAPTGLTLVDTPGLTVTEIEAAAEGARLVVIDYVQLIRGAGITRDEEVTAIMDGLQRAARRSGAEYLVLSQLPRAVEGRAPGIDDVASPLRGGVDNVIGLGPSGQIFHLG